MQRTKTLTTYTIKVYKGIVLVVVACFLTLVLLKSVNNVVALVLFGQYTYLFYYILRSVFGIKYVEYDNSNLYVKHNDYEVQIPFEEIKEVKLLSLDRIYCFSLYKQGQLGAEIRCKPSIWYPFNYGKVDDELHRIRGLIYKRKQEYFKQNQGNENIQLSSMNLN